MISTVGFFLPLLGGGVVVGAWGGEVKVWGTRNGGYKLSVMLL
jgi:hypothetical protein